MDLQDLKENRNRILKEFSEEMNDSDARHIRYEINWLLSKIDNNSWNTLEDAYKERISGKQYSEATKNTFTGVFAKNYTPALHFYRRYTATAKIPAICSKFPGDTGN